MNLRFFLIYNGVSTEIYEPVHFDNFKPKLKRDSQAHGVTWEYAEQELGFYEQAADIVRQAYNTDVDSEMVFLSEYQCNNGAWKEFYRGVLDFMTYNEVRGNSCIVNVGLNQLGIQMTFKNRYNNKVDIDSLTSFDGAALPAYPGLGKIIELPSKTIKMVSETFQEDKPELSYSAQFDNYYTGPIPEPENCNDVGYVARYACNMSIRLNSIRYNESAEVFAGDPIRDSFGSYRYNYPIMNMNTPSIVYKNTHLDLDISGTISADWGNDIFNMKQIKLYPFALKIGDTIINLSDVTYYCDNADFALKYTADLPDDFKGDIVLEVAMRFYVVWRSNDPADAPPDSKEFSLKINDGSRVSLTADSDYLPTQSKTYLIHEAMSRAAEIVTNGALTVKSDYYGRPDSAVHPVPVDGCGSLRAITRGLNVRNAKLTDLSEPKTEISLRQLLINDLNAIDNIGFGIEGNVLRVEPYEYFYRDEVVMVCKSIDKITREVVMDNYLQSLNIGYEKWEAEEYNGIDGFHGKREYRTKLKINNAKLEKYCKLIADGYAIEATRRRQIADASKDWRYDNDIFLFDLRRGDKGVEVNTGIANTDTLSLIDPSTVYNARLSPARMAMRWYGLMMQAFNAPDKLLHNSSEGYDGAEMLTGGPCMRESHAIIENQDIAPADMAAVPPTLWRPETVTFKYPMSVAEFERLRANPLGLIQFEDEFGWIKELVFDITMGLAEFTLIVKR
jgi:hypothetical protein